MKRLSRIQGQQELIKDLSAIIVACNSALQDCRCSNDHESLKKELVITYEERERQYKRLQNMLRE